MAIFQFLSQVIHFGSGNQLCQLSLWFFLQVWLGSALAEGFVKIKDETQMRLEQPLLVFNQRVKV